MTTSLYPLKFRPILKDKIWGGNKLLELLKKNGASGHCGESWEVSGVPGDISEVSEGFLAGNTLQELIEVYMGDLIGDEVYEKFGLQFPLLVKFIDAADKLSIQVHPNDDMAMKRHGSFGKTEMWYVVQADAKAEIIVGFKEGVTRNDYLDHLQIGNVEEILNIETARQGDVFFLPAGRVHAIGAGLLIAEVQQTSDITYRIYDFKRRDEKGNLRELHTDLAVDAIDYKSYPAYKTPYQNRPNEAAMLVECDYFTTNLLELDKPVEKDFFFIDSFVLYICTEGACLLTNPDGEPVTVNMGETLLVPAAIKSFSILPQDKVKLLEVYIS